MTTGILRRWLILASHVGLAFPCGTLIAAPATIDRPLMRDFIGVNGHTVKFRPELYRPTASRVRDYHPVEWDLGEDSSVLPPFPFAKNKVDWSQVYGSWRKQTWTIDACLMFESVKRENWKDIPADAHAYGKEFAEFFGPAGDSKLVHSVEIGNEPGKWSDAEYALMFKSMASGIREGDPGMKIATCNLTTRKSGDYEKSVECLSGLTSLYDVLTIHSYAQLEGWPTWKRSFPEDPKLDRYLQDIQDLCTWRDQHAPGKPVWITEFGYDSTTQPNETSGTFEKWQGVSDTQQAQWLVRSFLMFSSMPVERAYIYFFNDENKPGLHASAGLTRNFVPKPSFHAVAHLQKTLGAYRFVKTVRDEAGQVRIQEYRDESGKIVWVAWSPTLEGAETTITLENLPGKWVSATRMPLSENTDQPGPVGATAGKMEIKVSGSPLYIHFSD